MMANQPRLVNKQFNSPIGLYSQQNIQEVLHRDMQVLTNGGVGINFYNPGVGKPANLQNSAVLRMLEEESRHGTTKREVVSIEDSKICSKTEQKKPIWPPPDNERKRRFRSAFKDVVIPGTKRVAWPPLEDTDEEGAPKRPITPCHIPNKVIEPPPATITLRPQAPVSQAPPPVFTSQPATATFKGGKSLRGDLKWPPETVKQQAEEENKLRMELARGPVFRPRKVKKDYSNFFAQHALNSSYPGYRAPPGTQYYGESDY